MSAPTKPLSVRQAIERSGLLPANVLDSFFASHNQIDDAGIYRRLVEERLLTSFQAENLAEGACQGFFLTEKYKLLEFIGKGGMGKVFLCEHLILQRLVAAKVLQLPQESEPDEVVATVERFYREARAVASLDHPNIVRLFDVDQVESSPFMVIEYVDGTNLHELVQRRKRFAVDSAAHCIKHAAEGLEHAHRMGLIHRDIKPSNILLDRHGTVKILDLGLARFSHDLSKNQGLTTRFDSGSVFGTVDFIAPEQALGGAHVDGRADIYSLGCTMYFLLTGSTLFPTGTIPQKMYWHTSREPESVRTLCPKAPRGLVAVLERMMAKDPAKRFQSAAEVAAALAPWTSQLLPLPSSDEMPCRSVTDYRLGLMRGPAAPSPSAATPRPTDAATETVWQRPRATPSTSSRQTAPRPASSAVKQVLDDDVSFIVKQPPRPFHRQRLAVGIAATSFLIAVAVLIWWRPWSGAKPTDSEVPAVVVPPVIDPIAKKQDPPFVGVIVTGGGSTFVNPVMQHWAAVYFKLKGVRIEYQGVGSTRGSEGVIDRVYLFGCTDAPLNDQLLARARMNGADVIHIPLVMGAIVPIYNLPDVQENLRFTGPILADIYQGKIKRWNDPALRVSNPGVELPDMPITVVHRAEGSGSTFIWTDYLSKVSAAWKAAVGSGTTVNWPTGERAQGSNGVANLVSRNLGAIGYVELSYAIENNLKVGAVKNREGHYVAPSLQSVTAAAAASLQTIPDDLRYVLSDAPGDDSYPLAGTTWAIIYVDQAGAAAAPDLVEFLRWATHEGQAYVKDLRFAPLPPELVKRIDDKLARVRLPKLKN